MRDIDHIRKPGHLAAMKQIALNAQKPDPIPWWVSVGALLRRWTVQA